MHQQSFRLPSSCARLPELIAILFLLAPAGVLRATTADEPPVITEQPQPQTSFEGANVNLHVSVIAPPGARYRWRFYGTNLPAGFPGQSTPLLQMRAVTTASAGPYSVVISNSFGSVTSAEAVVTINEFSGGPAAYVNLDAQPAFSLFTQPFWQPDQSVGALLPGVPEGCSIFKLDGNGFVANNFLHGWSRPEMALVQGEGWFFHNPTTESFQLTFVGALIEGSLTNRLPAGHSLAASLIPQAGLLSTELGFPIIPGAGAYLFDSQLQHYLDYQFNQSGWHPFEPFVSVASAFWTYTPIHVDWVREFNDFFPGSYRIIQPLLDNESGQVNFFTYNSDGVSGKVLDIDGVTPLQADFLGQLYAGTNDTEAALRPVGKPVAFLDGAGAGYVRGNMVKIPGAQGGQDVFLQLRVWESGAGDGYAEAVFNGGASGRSAIFSAVAHATHENGGPGLPPRNANTFPAFTVSLGNGLPLRVARAQARDGGIEIGFATQPGWIYRVQKAASASPASAWNTVTGADQIIGTGHVQTVIDTLHDLQGFYRVVRIE